MKLRKVEKYRPREPGVVTLVDYRPGRAEGHEVDEICCLDEALKRLARTSYGRCALVAADSHWEWAER